MKYTFKAKAGDGSLKAGTIDAPSHDEAVALLQKGGLLPISLVQQSGKGTLSSRIEQATSKVGMKDLLLFYREFSTLTGAKVPIATALDTIQAQTTHPVLSAVVKQVSTDVEDGLPISEAFAKHPKIFSELAINMIKAGEISGNLEGSIKYVTTTTEQNYQLTSKVRGALMYPAFVVSVAGVIGFLVVAFILPKLTSVFKDLDVDLPWYTQIMIGLGDFMKVYWWVVLIGIIVVIVSSIFYLRSPRGKMEWDQAKLKIPVIGELFRYVYLTRFAENLSVLIAGGIPIVRALQIIADVVDNHTYKKIILKAAQNVKVGGEIHTEFFKYEEVPPMVARMIKVGEETGRLGDILSDVANFYRGEVDQITRNLSSLIEPILIVVLGIGVGVLVISVLMPIYNITALI